MRTRLVVPVSFLDRFRGADPGLMAAAVAFNGFFALIPASFALLAALSFIPESRNTRDELATTLRTLAPDEFADFILDLIDNAAEVIAGQQITIIVISVMAMLSFYALLTFTRMGKAMRAMSSNRDLARARAVNVERVTSQVWFLVGTYAAIGGALIGLETIISLELGTSILLPAFAAAVLGGIGNVYGAMLGALIIGFAENFLLAIDWSFLIPGASFVYIDTGYKLAIAFSIMLVMLIFRPRGLFSGSSGD